jgi:orotate phosphoribosyltransferase
MANLAYADDDTMTPQASAFERLHSHSGRKSDYFVELKRLVDREHMQ